MQQRLLVATDGNGKLAGIAPIYLSEAETRKFLKTKRLEIPAIAGVDQPQCQMNSTGSYAGYINKPGNNTRPGFYNRRKHLAAMGDVKHELTGPNNINQDFELLNTLHARR